MAELLLELFSEEIPARMQARAAEDLKRLVTDKLTEAGLNFERAASYVTPRRLALRIDGLPEKQPDVTEEKKGPRVGSPDPAIQGFLKGAGLSSLDQCEKRMVGKAEFWFALVKRQGRVTADVLGGIVNAALAGFPWPKSMRWANGSFIWVRPLHSVLCVFGGTRVAGAVALGGREITYGDVTHGHRFLGPAPFAVTGFDDYQRKLHDARVVLDQAQRREIIARNANDAAKREGLTLKDDPGLLDEVTGLVEWPVVLTGAIDAAYMDLPAEVLTTSMRAHQKYFALLKSDGALASRFLVVSNMETDGEGRRNIVAGNERVLRARLSDAKFFWDQDRKIRLEERVPALEKRVFHAKLGTVADKAARMQSLLTKILPATKGADADAALRAVLLCKADLSSGMVGEFPELQGVMGRYYALHDGEPAEIADAIRDHYAPAGAGDRCPTAPVATAVALADRIDTLAGFWKIGEKPTGSRDPYALRRAALGVIRLVIENGLRLPLRRVFVKALARHGVSDPAQAETLVVDLLGFFADRLNVYLREKGVRHDLIAAVFARGGDSDVVRILARVDALKDFLAGADGANLLTGYRRASNIVGIEEKKDKARHDGPVQPGLLKSAEETTLHRRLAEARASMSSLLALENFHGAMMALARLREPIDAFFDKVTVNAPEAELRTNRLRLLSEIRRTLGQVADFSCIEG